MYFYYYEGENVIYGGAFYSSVGGHCQTDQAVQATPESRFRPPCFSSREIQGRLFSPRAFRNFGLEAVASLPLDALKIPFLSHVSFFFLGYRGSIWCIWTTGNETST